MRRVIRFLVLGFILVWLLRSLVRAVDDVFGGTGRGSAAFAGVFLLGFALTLGLRRLRLERPWLWWPVFGAGVALVRMAISWRATCEESGLSIPAKRFSSYAVVGGGRRGGGLLVKGEPMRLIAPTRVRLRLSRCALILTVRLHPGQTPAEWDRAAEAFAHQWRVYRVRSISEQPGFITLTGLGFDPLRHPRPPAEGSGRGPDQGWGPGGGDGPHPVDASVLKVPVGIQEDGQPWALDLSARPHYLVTGATRAGKSTLTVRFLAELSRRPVALIGIDCKNGMELSPFAARLSALATNRAEAVAAIDGLLGLLDLRTLTCREYGARNIWELPPEVRLPPLVVIVDEIAELFLAADKEGKAEAARCVTGLVRLSQLGAALGIHLWISGQRFGSDLGSGATLLRAQLSGRVCHRVADHETAVMTLAGLPGEAVEEAQKIATDMAGVAVVGDDSGSWMLARADPLTVAQAAEIALQYAHLMVTIPEVEAGIAAVRLQGGGWS